MNKTASYTRLTQSWVVGLAFGAAFIPELALATIGGVGDDRRGEPGELVFVAYNLNLKVSYSRDLGIEIPAFKVAATSDAGYQRFWVMDDANWASLVAVTGPSAITWALVGSQFQSGAGIQPYAEYRTYSTVTPASTALWAASPSTIATNAVTNSVLNGFTLAVDNYLAFLNNETENPNNGHNPANAAPSNPPEPNPALNGTSFDTFNNSTYIALQDFPNFADNIDGTSTPGLQIGTPIGRSSWFYELSRSGPSNIPRYNLGEFRNRQPCAPSTAGTCAGYFGFVYVDPALYPTATYAGKYLLSYTIQPCTDASCFSTSSALREFAAGIGRTEVTGALWTTRLSGVATPASTEIGAGWSRRLLDEVALDAAVTTAVPEPSAAALLFAGLLAIGAPGALRRLRSACR